jgi:hypothetical protein
MRHATGRKQPQTDQRGALPESGAAPGQDEHEQRRRGELRLTGRRHLKLVKKPATALTKAGRVPAAQTLKLERSQRESRVPPAA